ncbi:LPS export ABC transporter ATP-binding protein [bacterium BMS3Abin03]|jgi:lipopolysaccharide export system ATP-binding protein|nr:LPS export ABC transporter ATP-binding protein [bacterium BMS3Abin03]
MATTLRSEGLVKIYKKRKVVNKASVEVSKGEIVGLLGPNGAGKTTTFYMIMGMIKPEAGRVFLDNTEITTVPMYKRAKMGVGYLPQENSIFRMLSVEDNLMAVLEMTNLNAEQRNEKMEKLLDELSIRQIRKSKGFQLSGGERRRTEIARALATDPSFILLDEPFAGIDPIAVEDIMNIVANLKNRGIGVLITDHNVHETLSIVDKAYILINGVIFKQGTADELANDEEVKKLYLGEKFRLDRYS